MFERYTEKARRVIFFARYEAGQYGSQRIETEHLLIALFKELDWKALLGDIDADSIRREVGSHAEPDKRIPKTAELPLSLDSKRALNFAVKEADRGILWQRIGMKHLMSGLLLTENCRAAQILKASGVAVEATVETLRMRKGLD